MFYDTKSYRRVHDETLAACAGVGLELVFMVVDDSAGTDEDVNGLADLTDVEVVTAPFNLGHQRAIVHGLRLLADRVGDDDLVVTMDSDGEDQPSDVPRLLAAIDSDHSSLALARRTQRSESWSFRVMYTVYRFVFRLLTGTTVRSGNFAVQRGDSLRATIEHPTFDLCYSSSLLALRRPTTMVPCARGRRFAGTSRMNAQSLMAHGVRMLLPFAERIAVRAMALTAVAGGALAVLLLVLALGIGSGSTLRVLVVLTVLDAVTFLAALTTLVSLFGRFDQGSRTREPGAA
ncbi:glycosyltransferase [Ilumatobacter nonamiensis]|uniref:glycosyltransferase n=1 Tax=Ilumatobacter nonamiensis TaxID=467093 RepID=UPI0019D34135|nr:glycosyltransferase [Ilumatobacter nonamiensis]